MKRHAPVTPVTNIERNEPWSTLNSEDGSTEYVTMSAKYAKPRNKDAPCAYALTRGA